MFHLSSYQVKRINMNPIVFLSLVVTCAVATPVIPDTICVAQLDPIAISTPDGPIPHIRLPTSISKPLPASSSSVMLTDDKSKIEYDFPAPISATPLVPVGSFATTLPIHIAAARAHVVPDAIETRVHYAETPVVVGHASHIMKPNLGGAHVTNFDFMGIAQTKTAAQESYVQKSKVLAPARSVSEITPQVTVQHPTKVNVQKVAVEVPVAAPYAHPVPVPMAPRYEIHRYQQSRHFPTAFLPAHLAKTNLFTQRRKQQTIKQAINQDMRKVVRKLQTSPPTSYRYAHFLSALESPRHFHQMLPGKTITNFSPFDESAEDRESHETYDN